MLSLIKNSSLLTVAGLVLSMLTATAFAEKPNWAEGQQRQNQQDTRYPQKKQNQQQAKHSSNLRFYENDRQAVYSYFSEPKHRAQCPPGLAKKNNGCQPPGQYKKWQKGKALNKHTRYYELPSELRHRLPRPHEGYRYIRVDNDVLLVEVATLLVLDAIENIFR